MSKVRTEEELLQRISEHQEEIKMLVHNYAEYIVKKHRNKKQKSIAETERENERENDNQCMALLKSKKRCTKKRFEEGSDQELCKLHNKSDTEIHKIELPPAVTSESSDSDDENDDVIQVKLTVDADGDTLDQEGNIWCLDKQLIIGKKDLRTKHKVFFKPV
jgi:hypothetical protein